MTVYEIKAKSILHKRSNIDSWFISHYGMNFYRGCAHNCVYCDGRSEKYHMEGEFGHDVSVKINAIDVLRRELSPKRKQSTLKRSFILLGGGVGDSYQPVEEKYKLTRKALNLMYELGYPVHILTKSTLVMRDKDIIRKINDMSRAVVSVSVSSSSEISTLFEPGVPSPAERLETVRLFKDEGIPTGVFLMPVIPFVTDTPDMIENTVRRAKQANVDFMIFGGMTLKEGKQKDYFLSTLKEKFPELVEQYDNIYPSNKWGAASSEYYRLINRRFHGIAKKHGMPTRMPSSLYSDILSKEDLVVVILENIDYILKMDGKQSRFGSAAHSISILDTPISEYKGKLKKIKGVNDEVEKVISEILKTGNCSYLNGLMAAG